MTETVSHADLQRDLGRIQEHQLQLDERLAKLERKVDQNNRLLTQAQGGLKVLILLGAAFGAVVAWASSHIGGLEWK